MKELETTIYMNPVAKGRPKITTFGGRPHAYTPARTRNAENEVQALIRTQVMELGQFDAGMPLYLEATFYRARPKTLPKRITMPVQKPDVDNYLKLLLDSLNKFVFPDDSAIVSMKVKKRFVVPPAVPCIYLRIREEIE